MTTLAQSTSDQTSFQRLIDALIRVGLVFLLASWCFDIVRPFLLPVLWGVILAVALYPVFRKMEGMMGGEARDRIAGFWRALGLTPPSEPDHLVALVGLYASLAEREAETDAERALLLTARAALLDEHLAPWIFLFLERVRELAGPLYGAWAGLLSDVLRAEVVDTGSRDGALSSHLRAAPPLPDPREEGSEAFLVGLLAPVRTGVILTRADLASIAGQLDMGLRAGERRYALEHLLAQEG